MQKELSSDNPIMTLDEDQDIFIFTSNLKLVQLNKFFENILYMTLTLYSFKKACEWTVSRNNTQTQYTNHC